MNGIDGSKVSCLTSLIPSGYGDVGEPNDILLPETFHEAFPFESSKVLITLTPFKLKGYPPKHITDLYLYIPWMSNPGSTMLTETMCSVMIFLSANYFMKENGWSDSGSDW